jgi:hypothetical protein
MGSLVVLKQMHTIAESKNGKNSGSRLNYYENPRMDFHNKGVPGHPNMSSCFVIVRGKFLQLLLFLCLLTLTACASKRVVEKLPEPAKDIVLTLDSFRQECPQIRDFPDLFEGANDLTDVKNRAAEQIESLGLQLVWTGTAGLPFSSDQNEVRRLKQLANIVIYSLKKYPSSLFGAVTLKKIILVKDLSVVGRFRKAMPEPSTDSLYYADNDDLLCLPGMEERVHHEFYHFIEGKINGDMYYHEPAWLKLNVEEFQYGNGGASVYQIKDWQNLGHPHTGFVSLYSESAAEEDKAEVFAWLMSDGFANRLKDWIKTDTILKSKTQFIIDFFQDLTFGKMGPEFFNKFAADRTLAKR